ncbi:hypothetical protein PNU89_15775, partial [[Ruminococcus] gnavus]|uniref:DUF6673 family protein n=1 Tax=Mediterraneibacter gnavus TaxID=33038 RepID=UPI002AC35DB3
DLENPELKERYGAELEKMKHVSEELPEGTALEQNKFLCGRVKQMFDAVFGKGTGDRVCGRGNDLLTCMAVYEQLITEQIRQDNQYNEIMGRLKMLSMENAPVEK